MKILIITARIHILESGIQSFVKEPLNVSRGQILLLCNNMFLTTSGWEKGFKSS